MPVAIAMSVHMSGAAASPSAARAVAMCTVPPPSSCWNTPVITVSAPIAATRRSIRWSPANNRSVWPGSAAS